MGLVAVDWARERVLHRGQFASLHRRSLGGWRWLFAELHQYEVCSVHGSLRRLCWFFGEVDKEEVC